MKNFKKLMMLAILTISSQMMFTTEKQEILISNSSNKDARIKITYMNNKKHIKIETKKIKGNAQNIIIKAPHADYELERLVVLTHENSSHSIWTFMDESSTNKENRYFIIRKHTLQGFRLQQDYDDELSKIQFVDNQAITA